MKVLNLRCANGHGFEGWFGSEDDFQSQNGRGLIECPLCADRVISRMPSAPRLNLSGAREVMPIVPSAEARPPTPETSLPQSAEVQTTEAQAAWLAGVRHLLATTEDVGDQFAEKARRIHYGEEPQRGIRGQATHEERVALREEGIETLAIPVPSALKGPVQ